MPSAVDHFNEYERFKNTMRELFSSGKPREWVVTITFYSVLHLVQYTLMKKYNENPQNHKDRNALISE